MIGLVSLNIERSRHLARVLPFLADRRPDVVCLQELMARDIDTITAATGLTHCHYVPMAVHSATEPSFGVGIFSRTPFDGVDFVSIAGGGDGTTLFDRTTPHTRVATCRHVIARAHVTVGGIDLHVATTHFPWTPEGTVLPFQTAAVARLIDAVRDRPVVLTGDFNAPRGGPIFSAIAAVLRDCIPPAVTTSIDPQLHRAGALQLMVDGLFASPHYHVEGVEMHTGLSDHQAISARIAAATR